MISRRTFIRHVGKGILLLAGSNLLPLNLLARENRADLYTDAPRARYWVSIETASNCSVCHGPAPIGRGGTYRHEKGLIRCLLCAQGCFIRVGKRGRCRTRVNVNGELKSLVYGRPVAIHTDPIEKKPFYHYLPGAAAFSLATVGCPLSCRFCQNWEISQAAPEDHPVPYTPPDAIVRMAQKNKAPVIAFTYNEPTVFTEYMVDIAREAKKRGIRSVLVTCGFMNEAPLAELCSCLDAIKVDLKGFSEDFYREVCGAELNPVLKTIKYIGKRKIHLEIVNLVVPTLNDSEEMLRKLADWLYREVGPDVPLHFTRFHPDYRLLNLPPTPVEVLERAREIAMERGLRYVYVGNVPDHPGNSTYCPKCGKMVISRTGFFVKKINLKNGKCAFCNSKIAGVWA